MSEASVLINADLPDISRTYLIFHSGYSESNPATMVWRVHDAQDKPFACRVLCNEQQFLRRPYVLFTPPHEHISSNHLSNET